MVDKNVCRIAINAEYAKKIITIMSSVVKQMQVFYCWKGEAVPIGDCKIRMRQV